MVNEHHFLSLVLLLLHAGEKSEVYEILFVKAQLESFPHRQLWKVIGMKWLSPEHLRGCSPVQAHFEISKAIPQSRFQRLAFWVALTASLELET